MNTENHHKPEGVAIAANRSTISVPVGDGAFHFIANPADDSLEWKLRYYTNLQDGNAGRIALAAASVLSSYDYLCSASITMKEATRRLRLIRAARRDALSQMRRLLTEVRHGDVRIEWLAMDNQEIPGSEVPNVSEIEALRLWIEGAGEQHDICTRQILGKVCSNCRCGKSDA